MFSFNCKASFIYAACTRMVRLTLWKQLNDFAATDPDPVGIGGDFNIISNASEHLGGNIPNAQAMDDFNSMISTCELHDIGFFGNAFTWSRGNLWQRLDRLLFNNDWMAKFHVTHVEHLSRTASDHAPLLLSITNSNVYIPNAFKFQNMWLSHHNFMNVVESNWCAPIFPNDNIYGMAKLWNKLSRLKQVLRWWNKHILKNLFSNIMAENDVMELENAFMLNPNDAILFELNSAKINLLDLQNQEEMYWKQKATTKFLVEGDRNTKFFHSLANMKRVRNHVFKITNDDGVILEEEEAILQSGVDHFCKFFNKDQLQETSLNSYIIPCGISDTDNLHLTMVPSEEEVWNVMQTLNGDSVAGPEGFTTIFFIKTWHIIKKDILEAVCDFFSGNPYILNFFLLLILS
ncbi:hypothetical protein KFK09_004155 [Dendrobium nobile]|uniref:Endonuclease/exonuclease/phosphatase domain-containing protein n=1 Tax=Dendrobium nobile TaxID=94219 RepID=A0A8T3C387_DENNO|nr:hypothetical protein KFK09_004155 [Dendrobium nobile]